eukprot:7103850-Prymnesium_polylepis.1
MVARRVLRVHVHAKHASVPQPLAVSRPVHASVDRLDDAARDPVVLPTGVDDFWVLCGRGCARERPRLPLDVFVIKDVPRADPASVGTRGS